MEHNYGHGEQHLSVVLMMMLAFLMDQTQQLCCPVFQAALEKLVSKRHLWEKIRAYFIAFLFDSMTQLLTALVLSNPPPPSPHPPSKPQKSTKTHHSTPDHRRPKATQVKLGSLHRFLIRWPGIADWSATSPDV